MTSSSQTHTLAGLKTSTPHLVEKAQDLPFSKRFFDKDNVVARRIYIKVFGSAVLGVAIAIFCVMSIYWGSLWKTPVGHLEGWVVDFDGGAVGQAVTQALTATGYTGVVKWTVHDAGEFPGGINELSHDVIHQKAWMVVTINEGSTARLQSSYVTPDPAYDGSTAITAIAAEGRNENAYRVQMRPAIETALANISQVFATQSSRQLLSANLTSILSISPQTITRPIWYVLDNVAPFNVPVASAITLVGLIYQLIFTFMIVSIAYGAREASGLSKKLTLRSLIGLRFASSIGVYFFISLCFSLLSVAFQVDFSRHYGKAGFVIFWMLNWLELSATGLALETAITILTPRHISYFMVLWVITNVSVCSYPIEVLPSIYRYGFGAPFYNVSHAVRSILFGTKDSIGLNFGVLIAWTVISSVTMPLAQWYVRRQAMIAERKKDIPVTQELKRVQSV